MRTDAEIEKDVKAELRWCPDIDETDVALKVKGGVVALTGFVHTLVEKYRVESAVSRIAGVAGVANDIEVRVSPADERPDPEIARDAVAAIRSQLPTVGEAIQVLVDRGQVTLDGKVEWQYQRESAESAASAVHGVHHVENLIQVVPHVSPAEIQREIVRAFHRNAAVDANSIRVESDGGEVTLRGRVSSFAERQEAQRTAWSAPGVSRVTNEIVVVPPAIR